VGWGVAKAYGGLGELGDRAGGPLLKAGGLLSRVGEGGGTGMCHLEDAMAKSSCQLGSWAGGGIWNEVRDVVCLGASRGLLGVKGALGGGWMRCLWSLAA